MRSTKYVAIHETFRADCQFCEPAGNSNNLAELKSNISEWLHAYQEEWPGIAVRELSKDNVAHIVYRVGYIIPFGKMGQFKIYQCS